MNNMDCKPWVKTYRRIKSRCSDKRHIYYKKGIKNNITVGELETLWFRDKAYLLEKPSIDRINSKGDYEFNNCRFIELKENQKQGLDTRWRTKYPTPICIGRRKEYDKEYRKTLTLSADFKTYSGKCVNLTCLCCGKSRIVAAWRKYQFCSRECAEQWRKILHFGSKRVVQLTMQGKIIAVYPSASEAARKVGGGHQNICKVANHRGNNISVKGYRWEWEKSINPSQGGRG